MFGISFGKLFVIIAVAVAVFWLMRRLTDRGSSPPRVAEPPAGPAARAAETLERCPACAAFVPAGRTNCGKPGCPYARI